MSSSEIAKLETRWRENPQGLTFAPLAEAYRKLREPARALEVLAEGLSRHPDYIPASIVLGRCHLDLDRAPEAESAFRRVLELDDENAIALKALADLSERDGRLAEAAGRLQELLAVDRSNDEARDQLARIEEALAAGHDWEPEPPDAAAAAAAAAEAEAEAEAFVAPDDLLLEDNLQPDADVEPLPDLVVDEVPAISSESAAAPPLGGLVGKDFEELSAAVTPLSDLAPGSDLLLPPAGYEVDDAIAGAIEHPPEVELDAEVELDREIEVQSEIELRPADVSEFQAASATDDWMCSPAEPEPAEQEEPFAGSAFEGPPEEIMFADELPAEPEAEPGAELEAEPEPEPEVEPEAEPEPESDADQVLTESMAELYLRQGHRAEALSVYRELYQRNRDDLRLRERVDALETELAAEESGAETPQRAFAAPAQGSSVAAFLGAIFSARPAGAPGGWSAEASGDAQPLAGRGHHADSSDAAPTRPAADHLSLSSVFGDAGSPVPPAVGAAAGASDEDGISFDAFFGGEAATGTARARAAARDDDDLDQFHAWLQNLKR